MSEKRYIEKARLIKAIEDLSDCYNGFSDTYDKACIIGVIEELPTINPVKHGRWVTVRVCGNKVDACTNCGDVVEHCEVLKYDFCPWCGARMVEGEEDE